MLYLFLGWVFFSHFCFCFKSIWPDPGRWSHLVPEQIAQRVFWVILCCPSQHLWNLGPGWSEDAEVLRDEQSTGDVATTARLLSETEENMLFLFRREPKPIRAAKPPRLKGPMKRGPCFGWRPTKSRSRENRGRGAQTVGILSTQDVSAGPDL